MQSSHNVSLTQIKVGQPAPNFSLPAFPSGTHTLDQYKGKKNVILAFYPKDDTPGCTKEMCSFSEDLSQFESANTAVFGISCDTVDSHEQFAGKYGLKQILLADSDGSIGKKYGVIAPGKTTASRVLFIIDKNGTVQYVHEGMPENAKILEIISKLK
jgi:peroxiredoxin Q/BCP